MTWSEITLDSPGSLLGGRAAAPDQAGKGAGYGAKAGGLDQLADRGRKGAPGSPPWTPGLVATPPSSWMGRLEAK